MNRRRFGYAVWLALAACLYFFENNTGTRAMLLGSLLLPLIPPLRRALFSPDAAEEQAEIPAPLTVKTFCRRDAEELGDVRPYVPGDPVRRIHWKLSAKKDELLIREMAADWESQEEERAVIQSAEGRKKLAFRRTALWLGLFAALCLALLLVIPEANRGAQALCNRVFAASEQINAYAYAYFPVAENQSTALAVSFLSAALAAIAALTVLLRSRSLILGITAACTLFQVYFGLPFPAWVNIPLYSLLALLMMKRPHPRQTTLVFCGAVLAVSLLTALLLPGVDAATETASEAARDALSRVTDQITGAVTETPEGETETRHVHTQSLATGENEAQADRTYRLVTVEEEQIAMPHWVNWLKIILLLLLTVALVVVPFAPFLALNVRRRKAQEARKIFASEAVGEAVCAIFQQVVVWLNAMGYGGGNRLYREWAPDLPDGYAERFARCAEDFEEAAYSAHTLPEEKRLRALALLKETETALWQKADWKQRFRLKYWMCLRE